MARYYLRAMELKLKGEKEPEWVPNDDGDDITLEHVLPENPGGNWPGLSSDVVDMLYTRLGNLVLLQVSKNAKLGNASFEDKKKVLSQAGFALTLRVANYSAWGPDEIADRQAKLAEHALETWPLVVK
ncbi:MAG: HNH endonuclease family protein [Acidobacteria bacterium]|nr:HNH endonuclease family protein [Acidobacteriota bacterium]